MLVFYFHNLFITSIFLFITGNAPYRPFMSTIAKQRGYSAFIIGLMFSLELIPGLFIRPIVGFITDYYKCRRLFFIADSVLFFLSTYLLFIIPGKISENELNDLDVIKSPLFWLFLAMMTLNNAFVVTNNTMANTVCIQLLGKVN